MRGRERRVKHTERIVDGGVVFGGGAGGGLGGWGCGVWSDLLGGRGVVVVYGFRMMGICGGACVNGWD